MNLNFKVTLSFKEELTAEQQARLEGTLRSLVAEEDWRFGVNRENDTVYPSTTTAERL